MRKRFFCILVLALLLISGCGNRDNTEINSNPNLSKLSKVVDKNYIKGIREMTTVKSTVHLTGEASKKTAMSWLTKGEYHLFFEYDAEFEVGVDIGDISINDKSKTVTVTMSEPRITSCSIIDSSIDKYPQVVCNRDGLEESTDSFSLSENTSIIGETQAELVAFINEHRTNFEIARTNAEKLIEDYIDLISDGTYTVVFN